MRIISLLALTITFACCSPTSISKERVKENKEQSQGEHLANADYNVIFENKTIGGVPVELIELGELYLPTGKIVACDPIVNPQTLPLTKTVEPGKYPVKLYLAKTKESGDRIAIAKLEFSAIKAEKWVLALMEGDDISELKDADEFFGFAVDAGMGGFFDFEAGLAYNKFTEELMKKDPEGNIYTDYLAAEFKKNAREPDNPNDIGDYVNLEIPKTGLNIAMFQSGFGDGYYPAYWGMTKNNEIVSVVIDFFVLPLEEKKK